MPASANEPSNSSSPTDTPVIPASVTLPEITPKAVVLSVVLAMVLAGANAYLGLFAGLTISASIPAAVLSMAILRLFPRSNILENNIVQTAASSGEAVAAGVIFTLPALLILGYRPTFDYWETTTIATVGGLMGVLFTIPLRRALIVDARLRFPEGLAAAEVLKAGSGAIQHQAGEGRAGIPEASERTIALGVRRLVSAALVGGGVKFCEVGLRLWADSVEGVVRIGGIAMYLGLNASPALLGVGFIVGLNVAATVFLGGAVGWLIGIPISAAVYGLPQADTLVAAAKALWSTRLRYLGVGAMVVGGLWTLLQLRGPVVGSLCRSLDAWRAFKASEAFGVVRTEHDAPLPWVIAPLILLLAPMAALYALAVRNLMVAATLTALMALAAFLFSAVAAYMAGLVGSSNNPVSGVTIATILMSAVLLVWMMGKGSMAGPAAAILIGAVVCCAAAMGGDNLQDLKTGHLVGATPWKQQIMQVVGVVTASLVLMPVLSLLEAKYGIGQQTAAHPYPLSAPQASLMASIAAGVFGEGMPWGMVALGAALGMLVILVDQHLERRGASVRVPVLAVAVGTYLPFKLSATILVGALIATLARPAEALSSDRGGLLCAAGLISGEALMGILLAIPVALSGLWPDVGPDPLRLFAEPPFGGWPGIGLLAAVGWWLYRIARMDFHQGATRASGEVPSG